MVSSMNSFPIKQVGFEYNWGLLSVWGAPRPRRSEIFNNIQNLLGLSIHLQVSDRVELFPCFGPLPLFPAAPKVCGGTGLGSSAFMFLLAMAWCCLISSSYVAVLGFRSLGFDGPGSIHLQVCDCVVLFPCFGSFPLVPSASNICDGEGLGSSTFMWCGVIFDRLPSFLHLFSKCWGGKSLGLSTCKSVIVLCTLA